MVLPLAIHALEVCNNFQRKLDNGQKLTEIEHQLYEASARYATTVLNFEDACTQSALLKAEREFDDTAGKKGKAG